MEGFSKEQKLRQIRRLISSPENSGKNAVSLLLEVATQAGERISFDCVNEFGLSLNTKFFTCEVKLGSLLGPCKATASTKKAARLYAAEQAVEMLKTKDEDTLPLRFSPVRKIDENR